jgi:Ice-binding-like/Dockerin type I domain
MSWLSMLLRGATHRATGSSLTPTRRLRLESLEDRLQPAFSGLGMAGNFAVLGLANTNVHNYNAVVSGHAGIAVGGKLNNWAPSTIMDNVYESASGQYAGTGQINGQLIIDASSLSQANTDALTASQEAAALTSTQTFGAINQPTIVIGNGGVNVIRITGDIRDSLTFSGTPADVFIVNVSGKLMLTGNSQLGLAGGATADHVLYNIIGAGGNVSTGSGNVVNGTLLAPNRTLHLDGVFNGEVIGGGTIKLSDTHINGVEFELPTAARVLSTVINGGAVQRSRVTDVTVTFDRSVVFSTTAAAAFTLVRDSDSAAVNFTATVSSVNGQTVVTLSNFTGSAAQFGSLADGRFTLTALSSQISTNGLALDGDGNGQAGGDYAFGEAQGLYRFFGDINGDRQVDIADYGQFTTALFSPVNYNAAFDFNGDGVIDIADFGQISLRIFTNLP